MQIIMATAKKVTRRAKRPPEGRATAPPRVKADRYRALAGEQCWKGDGWQAGSDNCDRRVGLLIVGGLPLTRVPGQPRPCRAFGS